MGESGNGIQDHNARQEIDAKQKLVEEANRKEEQAQLRSCSSWKDNQDGLSFVTQKGETHIVIQAKETISKRKAEIEDLVSRPPSVWYNMFFVIWDHWQWISG